MIYLGGVFYSIDLLPAFWSKVSLLNPVLYMVNGFRYGILGVSDVNIVTSFLMLTLFILGAVFWAMWLMLKAQRLRH
jgi:ABC-2 type transport system permease protein